MAIDSSKRPARQLSRSEIPEGASLCDYCTGKCCRYIALPIDEPETWEDYDAIRWYLTHEDISVFVEDGSWYIMIFRECKHLQSDHRCGIYYDRPEICRDYSTENCEYDSDFTYEKIFEHDDQIWEYAEAVLGPENVLRKTMKSVLPIVG